MADSTTVKVELSPEDARFAAEQVEAGTYRDISEAAREAFKVLRLRSQQLENVRQEYDQLCADMDAGKGHSLDAREFATLVRAKVAKHCPE